MRNSMDIQVGTMLTVAMLGPVVGGVVRTWTDDGTALWQVDDPEGLRACLGAGVMARTRVPADRFREVAMLGTDTGTLLVQSRHPDADGRWATREFGLAPATAVRGDPWADLEEFLGAVAEDVSQRDEFAVVELGGWDAPREPYVFVAVLDGSDAPRAIVEAAPVPRGTGVWPDDVPAGRSGITIEAPALPETLAAAGVLAAAAVRTWDIAPWDVAITYGGLDQSGAGKRPLPSY